MTPKDMLSAVLQRAELTTRERESFEDMWDRINRYGRCSAPQKAWIEKVYYGQHLERPAEVVRRRVVVPAWQKKEANETTVASAPVEASAPVQAFVKTTSRDVLKRRPTTKSGTFVLPPTLSKSQIGFINYPGVQDEKLVTSLLLFEEVCPRIVRGSRQYQRIAEFFAHGGLVLKVKPPESKVA